MNRIFLAKSFRSFFVLSVLFSSITLLTNSCKDREEDPYKDVLVTFKIQSSSDVMIKSAVSQVGTEQSTNFNVTGNTWTTTPVMVNTKVGAVHLASTAKGGSVNSELIVTIFVDGEKKASDTAKGLDLTASTMVDFIN